MSEQDFWADRDEELARQAAAQPAPSPASPLDEALALPVENATTRWRREAAEQDERQARARRELVRRQTAMTEAVDWAAHIQASLANERAFLIEVVGTAIGELRAEMEEKAQQRVDDAMRPLRVELAELKISNCELRLQNNKLREQLAERSGAGVADLPSSLCGRVN